MVTDPPYGLVEYSGREQAKLRAGRGGVWRLPPSFDGHVRSPVPRFTVLSDRDLARLESFFLEWARALYPVLVPGANVLVASNPLVSYRVASVVTEAGFERRGEIVRRVMTMRGGDRPKNAHEEFPGVSVMPRSMWEPWLTFRKPLDGRAQDNLRKWGVGGFRRISADRPFGDVIDSGPTRPEERSIAQHPSLKPQAFLRQIVRAALPLGEGIVLDPFAGSARRWRPRRRWAIGASGSRSIRPTWPSPGRRFRGSRRSTAGADERLRHQTREPGSLRQLRSGARAPRHRLRRAARATLASSIVTVMGPTPPGTGVIAPATSRTRSKSTSPARR